MEEKSFNQRLMDAKKAMVNPIKDKKANVGKFSYSYETLQQVLDIVEPALEDNGLMLVQGIKWHEPSGSFVLETGAADEKETHVLDTRHFPICDDAQAEGSWETYKRRYALRTAFGLAAEDDDGASTKKQPKKASGEDYQELYDRVSELARLTVKTEEEVQNAVMKSKTMKDAGATAWEKFTESQANAAIQLLDQWILKENNANMAAEDIEF